MKDFPDVIVVPAGRSPSYLNGEALTGALVGDVLSDNIVGTLAGGAIGGMIGKERMQHESEHGREVHKPGSLGGKLAFNGIVGGVVAGLFAAALAMSGMVLIAAGIVAGGAAIGSAIGYVSHQGKVKDYDAAKSYFERHGGHYEGREREAQKSQSKPYQVTPEEYALLQQKLAAAKQPHPQGVEAAQGMAVAAR